MTNSTSSKKELFSLRKKIDILDDQIISLLEKRFAHIQKIKKGKKFTDKKREEQILSKTQNPSIQKVYKTIFKESKSFFSKNLQSKTSTCHSAFSKKDDAHF